MSGSTDAIINWVTLTERENQRRTRDDEVGLDHQQPETRKGWDSGADAEQEAPEEGDEMQEETLEQRLRLLEGEVERLTEREQSYKEELKKRHQELVETVQTNRGKLDSRDVEIWRLHQTLDRYNEGRDPHGDEHIEQGFDKFEKHIIQLVTDHFTSQGEHSSWADYEAIPKPVDRDWYLKSWIATQLYHMLFSLEPRLFGIDRELDTALSRFEALLMEKRAAPSEVAKWRTQTVQLVRFISPEGNEEKVTALTDELCKTLARTKPQFESGLPPPVRDAVYWLCDRAFTLAMDCRDAKAIYVWEQTIEVTRVDPVFAQMIPRYNVGSTHEATRGPRIMFGPLCKQDSPLDLTLLRTGVVLDR